MGVLERRDGLGLVDMALESMFVTVIVSMVVRKREMSLVRQDITFGSISIGGNMMRFP